MRLVCPNCSAQYEVDDGLIPDEGRDVQCSNCGNTWFELPPPISASPDVLADASEAAEVAAEDVPLPDPEPDSEPDLAAEAFDELDEDPILGPEIEPEAEAEEQPEIALDETDDDDESWDWPETRLESPVAESEDPPSESPTREGRRPADVAALDMLREEAELEISQRRSETPSTMESQPEFGLQEPAEVETPSRALRARMVRLRGEDETEQETPEEDYAAPRRDLLPDIEEINSTLRPAATTVTAVKSPEELAKHRTGFRRGFLVTAGLATIMVVLYAWAPAIASTVPGTESALITYVDLANSARDALNNLLGNN
ncbi:MAG: hypothetical protein GKR98_11325 [Boseongicola sp.]|nr:MAG: hypothetical protein GKR98_11325 [Boseongicola sp.]